MSYLAYKLNFENSVWIFITASLSIQNTSVRGYFSVRKSVSCQISVIKRMLRYYSIHFLIDLEDVWTKQYPIVSIKYSEEIQNSKHDFFQVNFKNPLKLYYVQNEILHYFRQGLNIYYTTYEENLKTNFKDLRKFYRENIFTR